jgi:hypothetical protein
MLSVLDTLSSPASNPAYSKAKRKLLFLTYYPPQKKGENIASPEIARMDSSLWL